MLALWAKGPRDDEVREGRDLGLPLLDVAAQGDRFVILIKTAVRILFQQAPETRLCALELSGNGRDLERLFDHGIGPVDIFDPMGDGRCGEQVDAQLRHEMR